MASPALVGAQSTSRGKQLRVSFLADRLLLGYGDYSANTGPIHALTLDLSDQTVTDEATLTTEEVWGALALTDVTVPFIDPRGGIGDPENGSYATCASDGTWTTHLIAPPYSEHVFDMTESVEGLWAAGASQTSEAFYAQLWLSTDSGASWSSSVAVAATYDDEARFYVLCTLNGTPLTALYRQEGTEVVYERQDGTWVPTVSTSDEVVQDPIGELIAWHQGDTPFALGVRGHKPQGQRTSTKNGAVLTLAADAAQQAAIEADVHALGFLVDARLTRTGSHLSILTDDGKVWLHNGTAWTALLTVDNPDLLTGLAVDDVDSFVYFGTTDSRVLRVAMSA